MAKNGNTLMTSGVIWKEILLFSIPLILGNLFQQLYSVVDSVIVGNVVGEHALAAVGASGSIIQLLIGFIIGASAGAGVITSQYYGAQNAEGVRKAVHTTLAIAVCAGIILSVAGIVLTPWILQLMNTPEEVFADAKDYLRIFFAGHFFAVIYNMMAGILNAVGNSRRALIYLIIAAISNTVLDIIFVAVFKMGVVGAALATDISQGISCFFILRFLCRSTQMYRVRLKDIRFYDNLLSRIIRIGLPTGIQNIVVSVSNVIVQSSINSFGATVMASYAAFNRVDGFILLPILSISMAGTTFAGQNFGAGQPERIKQGLKVSVGMGTAYAVVTGAAMLIFGPYIISIFTSQESVIETGIYMMKYMYPFYWLIAIFNIAVGNIRGVGRTLEGMVMSIFSLCVCRVVWILVTMSISHQLNLVILGYPVTWAVGVVMAVVYLKRGRWLRTEEMEYRKSEQE